MMTMVYVWNYEDMSDVLWRFDAEWFEGLIQWKEEKDYDG